MNAAQKRYIENVGKAHLLTKPDYPKDMSLDDLIVAVQEFARMQSQLKTENDQLIKSGMLGLNVPAASLTQAQCEDMQDFARELSTFFDQIDNALSYQVHLQLLRNAEARNDLDACIRESYYCGLTLYYLNRPSRAYHINVFGKDILRFFHFGGDRINQLADFNPETQSYILRSYANLKLGYDNDGPGDFDNDFYPLDMESYQKGINFHLEITKVFADPALHAAAPTFNWDSSLYVAHFGRIVLLSVIRLTNNPKLIDAAWESANFVYQRAEQVNDYQHRQLPSRLMYFYRAAQFHKGIIPIDTLLDFFYETVTHADSNDFSTDSVFINMHCALHFLDYYQHYGQKSDRNDSRALAMQEHFQDYLLRMPVNGNLAGVMDIFYGGLDIFLTMSDETENHLLTLMLCIHQPTYVHVLMVAKLSRLMMEALLEQSPEYVTRFIGEDFNHEALLEKVYRFGIYHDTGKEMLIDTIGLYERSLTDEEFEIIREHCYIGYVALSLMSSTKIYAQGALGHHKFYNDKGGYPECYHRTDDLNQVIIDILTVCDSIDAATDNIGRAYAHGIDLDRLLNEFQEQRGTRYAPYVVDLLNSPALVKKVADLLRYERPEAYRQAYLARTK